MSLTTSSRTRTPSPDRSSANKENEPTTPTTPQSSPAGKRGKKSPKVLKYGGLSKSRKSPGKASVLGGAVAAQNSLRRRVSIASTPRFASYLHSEAVAELLFEENLLNARAKELTESPLADISEAYQPAPFSPSSSHGSLMEFES